VKDHPSKNGTGRSQSLRQVQTPPTFGQMGETFQIKRAKKSVPNNALSLSQEQESLGLSSKNSAGSGEIKVEDV